MILSRDKLLNNFGKKYINFVRDTVIHQIHNILINKAKAPDNRALAKKFKDFSSTQINICKELVSESIDSCLHYTLFMLEEYEDELQLIVKDKDRKFYSLAEISGALCSELYTEEGWIEKYTKYPDWKRESVDIDPEKGKSELWLYVRRHYYKLLEEKSIYQVFLEGDEEVLKRIIELFKDQILINHCPNCGNLKKTPQARQCLKCGQFHDPELV